MDKEIQLQFLYKMTLIRQFEEAVSVCKEQKLIYGGAHCCNGEEAIAVGVCAALDNDDYIVSNHRPHGHAIAKGVDPKKIMAEMFGKSDGTNQGNGGSMHIHDSQVGLITSSGIVGSGIPIGCGAAFAAKYAKNNKIACVFFGDGSANEGILHEALNYASIWDLPVLFLLEDNELAITANTRNTSACNDYVKFASTYNILGTHVNGQDVEEVYEASVKAAAIARTSSRPYLIQAHTIRFNEHQEGAYYRRMIDTGYRDYATLESEKKQKDPIELYKSKLLELGNITVLEIDEIKREAKKIVNECIHYAHNSLEPDESQAYANVFREDVL